MAAALSEILRKSPRCQGLVMVTRPCVASAKLSTDATKHQNNSEINKPSIFEPKMYSLKRGTGGRSSFNGVVATVFGATGFLGKYVSNKLGKIGTQIIIPYRGDHYDVLRLRLVGDLGQVLFFPYHLQDEESIRKAMKYSNVVINMVGRDWETMNFKYKDVNVTGARTIARLARECGVKRLIHFSSLNCETPEGLGILPDGSQFLRTKYQGELAVREEFPDATIFRPADIWGQEDRFVKYYAHHWRRFFQWVPLWHRGEKTIKQPVYVSDVAQGVINAIKDPDTAGQTYDLIGPKRYQLGELVDWLFRVMRRDEEWGYRRTDLRWSPMFQMRISATQKFSPSWPIAYLNWDKIERDHITDVPTGNPTLEDLGVTLTDMESRMHWELRPHRAAAYYDEELGEFAPPVPPKTVSANARI
ncbi:NADH dehydrogenase [ubiquinone] 1 alpha subcomplex subunit 9, mitochondrial [Orchesella cincta]|uniref:NADH dehydrogenase [ubiquinone] 1 alpha subcomplex subunit 9, mitochondrial n=1 Tax=Orchesella cincta TaxID=48709 RepID=A0A1D2MLU5_ORCCI|nr:NADH dehydrogenase [ubiquinone] 1 alpha subcomplex subunit 9, mitochondrial [Orchesella cincta]